MMAILEKTVITADNEMFGKLLASSVNIFDYLKAEDLLKLLQRSSISKEVKLKAIGRFGQNSVNELDMKAEGALISYVSEA